MSARRGTPAARNDLILDAAGAMTGRKLSLQPLQARSAIAFTLPLESFVAPATGSVIVYGWYRAESGSEVHAIDTHSGCRALLARPPDVVRSAVLDPSGTALYIHSVATDDRRDLGVSRYDLAAGTTNLAMEPLATSETFGPTFATELKWSDSDDALAVQSCGMSACRTRILDLRSGSVSSYGDDDQEGHGALVGVTERALFVLDRCHGAPCALVEIDRASGVRSRLAEEVFAATLQPQSGNSVLRIETAAGIQEIVRD